MLDKVFCTYCQRWRDPKGSHLLPVRSKSSSNRKTVMKFQCHDCHYRRVNKIPPDKSY